jgi:succinate dehydrogenase flavin-adding protein (antitoxin of CptAB toxin-antitoxin module)
MSNQNYKELQQQKFKKYIRELEELYQDAAQWFLDNQSQPKTGNCESKKIEKENQEVE